MARAHPLARLETAASSCWRRMSRGERNAYLRCNPHSAFARYDDEKELVLRYTGDFDMAGLVRDLWRLGGIGASRSVVVEDEREHPTERTWDGDGADKIVSATIDGKNVLDKPEPR